MLPTLVSLSTGWEIISDLLLGFVAALIMVALVMATVGLAWRVRQRNGRRSAPNRGSRTNRETRGGPNRNNGAANQVGLA
jgi:Na+/H+-translocating membrane pyrophosphatase